MKKNAPTYNLLVKKLSDFRKKESLFDVLTASLNILILALALILLSLFVESVFRMPEIGRLITVFAAFVAIAAFVLFYFVLPVIAIMRQLREPLLKTAMKVGRYFKSVNDRLANALQIYENYERDKRRFSLSLIESSLRQSAAEVKNADFNVHIDTRRLKKALIRSAVFGSFFMIVATLFFSTFSAAGYRLVHPMRDFSQEHELGFFIHPGHATVIKGEDIHLACVVSDSTYDKAVLLLENSEAMQSINLVKSSDDSFHYRIPNIRSSFNYAFTVGKQSSNKFAITVIERPLLRSVQLKVEPPGYSKIKVFLLDENIGDVSALKGSRVTINGVANKKIRDAKIQFSGGKSQNMTPKDHHVAGAFKVIRDDVYSVWLQDDAGKTNVSPIQYKIRVIPDNYPLVQILSPEQDLDLGDDMLIPLVVEAEDDFGISRIRLAYQILAGGEGEPDSSRFSFSDIQGFSVNDEQVRVAVNWDLSTAEMYPTDVLVYYVQVFDNDDISGPKSARSSLYRARFPSLYEMYEETANEQEDASESFEKALEKGRELEQKLNEMALEMKRTTEMDWQKKQEFEEAVQRQKEIEEHLENAIQHMDDVLEKMEKNDLFSQETMKKLEEIQNLYKEIMTPELQDAMQNMDEAMKNLDEKLLQQAMQNFKMNVEEYNKTLDRTLSLLKKLQAEQKLDQAQKMAQDLAERQEEISKDANKKAEDNQKLAKEQQRISADTEQLSDLLQQLQDQMKELPDSPTEQVQQAAQQMQQDGLQQTLSQLEQKLAQNQMSGVPEQSAQAQQSFQKMADNLEQAKQMMNGEMQQQAMKAMRKGSRQLLQLSKQQEQLMQQMQGMSRTSPEFMDMAEKQAQTASSLQRVVDGLAETMKNNFGIDPNISQSLGKAMMEMQNAINAMGERNSSQAKQSQGESMAQMNAAVRGMQQSMQNMMQQGGSGGMSYQQFLQQMQQMADQQGQLNRQSQAMGNQGQLTLGQQAALARLAAEQSQIRKSMQQMAREAQGMPEILGSLENIAEDMKKVEQDFANKHITRETINRQNRILSRMLDSQKSVNKREFSRERQAETGKQYISKSPDALPTDLGERENKLQQDLLRAKKEGYSRDYLKMIENYFKALTEHEMAN